MKPNLLLLTGIPGSGKSSFVNSLEGYQVLSLDDIRLALGSSYNIKTEPVVKMVVDIMGIAMMERGNNIVIDANILQFFLYEKWKRLADQYGYEIEIKYFDTPLEICIDRRKGQIDKDIIVDHYKRTLKLLSDLKANGIEYTIFKSYIQRRGLS